MCSTLPVSYLVMSQVPASGQFFTAGLVYSPLLKFHRAQHKEVSLPLSVALPHIYLPANHCKRLSWAIVMDKYVNLWSSLGLPRLSLVSLASCPVLICFSSCSNLPPCLSPLPFVSQTAEYIIQAFKFGSFAQVPEVVSFRERLSASLDLALARTELALLVTLMGITPQG